MEGFGEGLRVGFIGRALSQDPVVSWVNRLACHNIRLGGVGEVGDGKGGGGVLCPSRGDKTKKQDSKEFDHLPRTEVGLISNRLPVEGDGVFAVGKNLLGVLLDI